MQSTIVVSILGADVLDLVRCMLIDAVSFPRPSLQLGQELGRRDSRVWIARLHAEGPVVGFAGTRSVSGELHLIALATDPAERRRGVGTALLEAVLADAARRRRLRIVLQVAKSNRAAQALYAAHGFRAHRLLHRYYPDGEDAYQMVR
jgi:[ribosomal protein S18]-alanine N-acetyltransferase